jgi:hypothetical protein
MSALWAPNPFTKQLEFVPTAVILSLSILAFLILTTIALLLARKRYLSRLPRDASTLGSQLGFVFASERLLAASGDIDNLKGQRVKMGWFEIGGKRRWCIELLHLVERSRDSQSYVYRERVKKKGYKPLDYSVNMFVGPTERWA